ncbi:ribosome small subunit-dependent GTPase A [Berryella wangjianweii]|uniref:Small ribosomal subunit biogenesis GTPase RsgA n=1 Tax=Berryella wangjianweii TaxID=2734634 RepID=A0A6M8J4C6_9ACTN|nr:ribosome small subunit-dependent GTPase A [Berryella wangjianweii]QKF07483.1 ribosome small subunit-dependent GTPase A [Berryella wangjianweii]
MERGQVVQLDRGYPLVAVGDGAPVRCEHATALMKAGDLRATVGDRVWVSRPADHDNAIIERIDPRSSSFVRRDPAERTVPQVLAANFTRVIVVEPAVQVNERRLERELVLAHQTGVAVSVLLTKADLLSGPDEVRRLVERVSALAGPEVEVRAFSVRDAAGAQAVRSWFAADELCVLVGKSGVGKSSLVNTLAGRQVMETGAVREADGKGRHTTVSRAIVQLPGAGRVIDMPGVRGLGLWDALEGIEAAFPDVASLARACRFRDCAHEGEPGCAIEAALAEGRVAPERVASYRGLLAEVRETDRRREEARRLRGEKSSDQQRARGAASSGRARYNGRRTR